MTVITISRDFGSGGELLAGQVAQSLGYHLVDKVFVSAVLRQYGVAEFDVEYEKHAGFWEGITLEDSGRREIMVRTLNQVLRAVAVHGNVVILGRGGYAILSGLADVLHVRLQAPRDDRIAMVRARNHLSLVEAGALVKKQDAIRKAFIESFYHSTWDTVHAFDIAINTACVPVDRAVEWVLQAARLPHKDLGARPTTRQLEIDTVMQGTVNEKLDCAIEHA